MSVLILKDFRDKYNIDRDEQADLLGISIDTLNNWEYRTKKIPKNKLKNIEYVFSMYKKDINPIIKRGLKTEADNIALNFEEAKRASKLFDLTIQNSNKDYLIKKLAEYNIKIKE